MDGQKEFPSLDDEGPTGIRNRGLAQSYAEQSKARIIPLDHRADDGVLDLCRIIFTATISRQCGSHYCSLCPRPLFKNNRAGEEDRSRNVAKKMCTFERHGSGHGRWQSDGTLGRSRGTVTCIPIAKDVRVRFMRLPIVVESQEELIEFGIRLNYYLARDVSRVSQLPNGDRDCL
jgi:hypothetical protein